MARMFVPAKEASELLGLSMPDLLRCSEELGISEFRDRDKRMYLESDITGLLQALPLSEEQLSDRQYATRLSTLNTSAEKQFLNEREVLYVLNIQASQLNDLVIGHSMRCTKLFGKALFKAADVQRRIARNNPTSGYERFLEVISPNRDMQPGSAKSNREENHASTPGLTLDGEPEISILESDDVMPAADTLAPLVESKVSPSDSEDRDCLNDFERSINLEDGEHQRDSVTPSDDIQFGAELREDVYSDEFPNTKTLPEPNDGLELDLSLMDEAQDPQDANEDPLRTSKLGNFRASAPPQAKFAAYSDARLYAEWINVRITADPFLSPMARVVDMLERSTDVEMALQRQAILLEYAKRFDRILDESLAQSPKAVSTAWSNFEALHTQHPQNLRSALSESLRVLGGYSARSLRPADAARRIREQLDLTSPSSELLKGFMATLLMESRSAQ